MKMVKILVSLPAPLKRKLDALRAQGYTMAGYVRQLVERDLNQAAKAKKGR